LKPAEQSNDDRDSTGDAGSDETTGRGRTDSAGLAVADLYDDLRLIARRHLRRLKPGHTLNTTAVVHEAYLKIAGSPDSRWNDRGHFFALASTAMRQLLLDYARRRRADKRGGGAVKVTLEDGMAVANAGVTPDVLALDAALRALCEFDPMLEKVVECRFFAGLTTEETAVALGRSTRSVERDWTRARAYLFQALSG
jgi:RNA polymerase sigma factor (TIGR02999 family)